MKICCGYFFLYCHLYSTVAPFNSRHNHRVLRLLIPFLFFYPLLSFLYSLFLNVYIFSFLQSFVYLHFFCFFCYLLSSFFFAVHYTRTPFALFLLLFQLIFIAPHSASRVLLCSSSYSMCLPLLLSVLVLLLF